MSADEVVTYNAGGSNPVVAIENVFARGHQDAPRSGADLLTVSTVRERA